MSEPLSDADKIRNKRLAKLQQPQSSSPPIDETSEQDTNPSDQSPAAGIPSLEASSPIQQSTTPDATPIRTADSDSSASPHPLLSTAQDSVDTPKRIRITPAGTNQPAAQQRSALGSGPLHPSSEVAESMEHFEDQTIKTAFHLSLDSKRTKDVHGHTLYFVEGLHQELEDEGRPQMLTTEILERAIMEAGSKLGKISPLDWLLGSWKRLSRLNHGFKNRSSTNKKWATVQEAQRLCMSWCIFAITNPEIFNPEIFELETDSRAELADRLLLDSDREAALSHDFLVELSSRLASDDSIKDILIGSIEVLSHRLAGLSMDSDYRSYTSLLRNLVRHKPIAVAITESSLFVNKSISAADLETKTILGPYFQISPLQADVTKQYFSSPKTIDPGRVREAQRSLRLTLQNHQNELLDVVNQLLRASTEARERVLDWFALAINANHKRRALRVDKSTVSSDGFMINLTTCLDQLCEPFLDATFSKIDKIDVKYLQRNPRVNVKDETKINADQETSDAFYSRTTGGTNHFITELFFLTVAAHHYGTEATHSMLKELEKDLKHMTKMADQFETDRHKYVNNPTQLRAYENALAKYRDQIDRGLSFKMACHGVLLDELTQTRSMQFMRYVIVWVLRLVSPTGQFPAEKLVIPLSTDVPEAFKCLPEYFLDDICSNFQFILGNLPHIISTTQSDELVMLCITFLRSSDYINNPYLKAGLITILFKGSWPWRQGGQGVLANIYNSLPFATEHLLHALMQFFIEAEFMGGHGQFFDKFNVRYEVFQIIKCVWSNSVYRDNLYREAKLNSDFFVRFVNLLLNDVTFVLDESFTSFLKISELQRELSVENASLDQTERQEKEEALTSAQEKAKSYMSLTNEIVAMLKLFTEALGDSFTMPEIVQRLADMLDYNLDAMAGPKQGNLKVKNLETYNFNPKTLLAELVDVYLNLGDKPNFILAVARDGRSYKAEVFKAAGSILEKHHLKSPDEMKKWSELNMKIAEAKAEDEAAEQELGEIPDEFLDPLVYSLMEDPVILPTSRTVIDRRTIRSHLLSDPNDPFNRVPLKIEDVKPATEIKAKIEAFKQEKIGGRKKEFVETIKDSEQMDTRQG